MFAARVTSSAGHGFGRLALTWGTLELGHGAGGVSLVLACEAIPQLLLVLAGGIISDRFRRNRVLVGADLLSACTWAGLAACFMAGAAPLSLVCGLAVLVGVGTALFSPAVEGIVADLVEGETRQVANALLRQAAATGLIIGLALSGVVVAAVGPGWAAALNGVALLVSAGLLARLGLQAHTHGRSSPLAELRVGWREFAARQWLWVIALQGAVVIAVISAFNGVIGPLYMSQGHGGPRAWGLVAGCEALGTLVGGRIAAHWYPLRPIMAAVLLIAPLGVPMLLLAAGSAWPVLACAMLVAGVCQTTFATFWATTVQNSVPNEVLSRVRSWDLLGALTLAPLGLLVAGPVAATAGTEPTAAGGGLLILTAAALALLSPQVRTLRRPSTN
ncbi:putative MFS family arabinose efflux permease [Thermomonospora umbrina]|uniref:Putative MFS family arabinose efflux permease n=1 Tax=Thermomonospora umbrina TaxID=111806 RepID=A0A3D9SKK8_9ACTN|nr:putative MFS family arabinose efflux permease [Thermomonospora umbrina]